MTRIAVTDGTCYEARTGGAGPTVLLLHGFTGRSREWAPFLPALRRTRTTLSVDLLGHGTSDAPAEPARHAIERQAADLAVLLGRSGVAAADVVGYSLGARVALRLAIEAPERVRSLFLESPSAGFADAADRTARRESDERLAQLLEREGIEAFVTRWEALPLFASEATPPPAARARLRRDRLRNRAAGLAASLRGAGQGVMEPMLDRLDPIEVPVTVVAGERDLIGRRRANSIVEAIAGARLVVLPRAGHAPHREDPRQFRALLLEHLAATPTTSGLQHRRSP